MFKEANVRDGGFLSVECSTTVPDYNAMEFDNIKGGLVSAGFPTAVPDSNALEFDNIDGGLFHAGFSTTVPDSNAVEFDNTDGVFRQLVFYHNTSSNSIKMEGTQSRVKWRLRQQRRTRQQQRSGVCYWCFCINGFPIATAVPDSSSTVEVDNIDNGFLLQPQYQTATQWSLTVMAIL